MSTYNSAIKDLYRLYIIPESAEIAKNKALGPLKYEVVGLIYGIYNIVKNGNSETVRASYLNQTAQGLLDIINAKTQEEVINIVSELQDKVFMPINIHLYMNNTDLRIESRYRDYYDLNYYFDFDSLYKNISTPNKNINLFRIEPIGSELYDLKIKTALNPVNARTRYNIYTWGAALNKRDFENKEEETDYSAYGDRSGYKFDTNFDIGFINFIDYQQYIDKDKFYFTNSHVRKNGLIVCGLNNSSLSYDSLDFLSMYLEDVNVYKREGSRLLLVSGIATKDRKKNLHVLFSIIKQIISDNTDVEPKHNYNLVFPEKESILFRSIYLTKEDVEDALNKNQDFVLGLTNDMFNNYLNEDLKEGQRKPLIPFNPGQLGLVLVSGDIDGVVDEGNGKYHAIKGGVERVQQITRESDGPVNITNTVDAITTYVTVMLADGRILHLV